MNWKYIQNIDKTKDFAEMFIYDEISDDKISGSNFAYEMRYLIDYEKVKKIKIKINSVGGSVIHAQSIISEIIDAKEKGVCIETYNVGLCASSAGVIWLSAEAKNRYAKDYARLMIHGVSVGEGVELDENDRAALEGFKKTLIQILVNRTGKKEKFYEELFSNGLDNWFDTKEMTKLGLLLKENIETTDVKVDINTTAGVVVVYNTLKTTIENNITNKNEIKMKKVIALLKLQESASEEAVEAAVISVQNKLSEAEKLAEKQATEIEALKAKNQAQEATIKESNDANAVDFVEQMVTEGKIDPAKKEEVLVEAKNNLSGFKNLMKAIPGKAANILNKIETGAAGAGGSANETRGFRELEKSAPNVLNAMKKNDLKQYVNLYNAEYGTAKTEADFQ